MSNLEVGALQEHLKVVKPWNIMKNKSFVCLCILFIYYKPKPDRNSMQYVKTLYNKI